MAENSLLKPPSLSRKRSSSVGNIGLGDTKVPGLSTMSESKESKIAARARLRALSGASKTDIDIYYKLWLSYRELNYRHAWLTPLIILFLIYSCYFASGNRTESNPLHMFVAISYRVGNTNMYGKGVKDMCFVFYYMVFFTFLREFMMEMVLRPLTFRLGVTKPHKVKRMMEQAYSTFYYGLSGPFGLFVMYRTDLWLFKTAEMYKTYPDLTNEYYYKIFYLGQAAFWAQQACILVLQLEKPRKDFRELVFHHIVTLALISLSYVFHFTKMGLAVYITMDVSDFFLALSKIFNYMESSFTAPLFLLFVSSWVYLRHYVNIKILWSVLTEFRTVGDYTLNFATEQYKSWIALPIVFGLIFALHLVNLYWLALIFRILYRMLFQGVQKDERSDSESEDNEEELDDSSDETDKKKNQ
ncbi:ABR009Wp [Eremothecium gossypii ATCC 10895]|uniref:ABR009Wp n=1 Tax=Eremothecium gossypii (strain ATCC 10895 / CBS 109.51 / FGSC 9923 / NRRL Y-1056) TaxID=284811 RepID=Q75DL2_EREGS|nr:ABR009Wp [Eremothecium gossypii ATCC 10895]AAS50779.1 ABR009Wp [Eremothecium gossypii ATCC 10895]AEY95068.1 FABR009Wp [Eremothecium gossypii FDAG1]